MIITAMWLLCQHWPARSQGEVPPCRLPSCHLAALPSPGCQPNSTVGRWMGMQPRPLSAAATVSSATCMFITLIIVKQMFVEKTQDCICGSVPYSCRTSEHWALTADSKSKILSVWMKRLIQQQQQQWPLITTKVPQFNIDTFGKQLPCLPVGKILWLKTSSY